MNWRDPSLAEVATAAAVDARGGRRLAWHVIAMLVAAALAWLVFTAYRQPEFILDFAAMRLC
jgi:hypothetical protein